MIELPKPATENNVIIHIMESLGKKINIQTINIRRKSISKAFIPKKKAYL